MSASVLKLLAMSLELAEFSVSTSECQRVETYRPFMSLELAEFSVSTSECQRVASGKGSQFVGSIIGEERGSRETWIRCVVHWHLPSFILAWLA